MATFAPGGAQRYEQHSVQNINDDVYEKCNDIIIARTGMQALSYEHLYGFKKHVDKFVHQNPQGDFNRRNRATPLGLGSDRIPEQLDGWENISDEQKDTYHQIFNRYSTDEMQIAFDRFFQRQGRRPFVDEFSRYLLILEGNDHHDTSRKTLGNLFLESEELKHVVEDDAKVIESLGEMMASKDVMNDTLSEAYSDLLAERENLKIERDNYQAVLKIAQGERAKLEEDKNTLTMDLSWERNQNEDLRGEKIRLDESCKELYSQNVQLESQNVQLESQNVQLEKDISDARSEVALVEAKLEMLDDTLVVFTSLLANVELKLSEAESNVESLLNENGSLKDKLTDVTEDNQKLSGDNQKLSDDNQKLSDDNQKLSDDKFRLQQTLDTVTDDKFRLQQTLDMNNDDYSRLEKGVSKLEHEKALVTRQLFLYKIGFLTLGFILAAFHLGSFQQYLSS